MFKRVKDWFEKNKSVFLICIIVFGVTFYYTPYFMNKPVAGEFEGSIQNKLVWSVKGECYFVRPLNQTDTLLVRVKDCDKGDFNLPKVTK